jgi:hypothetical protein
VRAREEEEADEEEERAHPSFAALGRPTPVEAVPPGWPVDFPHPPGVAFVRRTAPEQPLLFVEGELAADPETVLDWFLDALSDRGWLVLERGRHGSTRRLRLARREQRWLLVVGRLREGQSVLERGREAPPAGSGLDSSASPALEGASEGPLPEGSPPRCWLQIRRQPDDRPVDSIPSLAGAYDCESALPPTEARAPLRCHLEVGPILDAVPRESSAVGVAVWEDETAVVYESGSDLWVVTLDGELTLARGPAVVARLDAADAAQPSPQLRRGVDGWLVSWIDGDPPERVAQHLDEDLRPTGSPLRMSRRLAALRPAGWAETPLRRGTGYASAWIEQHDEGLAFRVAEIMGDGSQIRRSGRFPVLGAPPSIGPELVFDGETGLGMVWGSEDGIIFRAIAPDGLPEEPIRRLEPGQPRWLGAAFAEASFWVVWGTSHAGFWLRTNRDGCVDDARGALGGYPMDVDESDRQVLVQLRGDDGTRLVRLADVGSSSGSDWTELIGRSPLDLAWSHMLPVAEGLRGLVSTPRGVAGARWICAPPPE